MKKVQSIWLFAVALFTISTSAFTMSKTSVEPDSVKAGSVFRLSPGLQEIYRSWNDASGSIVFPCIEYKVGEVTNKIAFFSDKEWFDASVEIPSDILEFDIYLPTTMFGNYIKFTFSPARCHFPAPDLSHLDQEILSEIFHPQPQSFISEGHYSIDMRYIFNSKGPICAQCMLIRENQERSNILVSISDMP